MRKLQDLRAALTAALPEFTGEPDRLRLWVEQGSAQCRQSGTFGFELTYKASVLLVEATTDVAVVALAVFRWLHVNQPELLVPGAQGFTFDADVIDNQAADILLQLELSDCVSVAAREDGGFDLNYLPEPDPQFEDFSAPANLPTVPLISEIWLDGAKLVP